MKGTANAVIKPSKGPATGIAASESLGEPVLSNAQEGCMWVVVKIMVSFWVLDKILHLIFRGPKRGH